VGRPVDVSVETSRLEAFSDGVFAIAITLLILDVTVREGVPLGEELTRIWPSYVAYAVSFLTIGVMWVNHHTIFSHIARADRVFLFLNLLLLLGIAFVPFPTGLLAEHIREPGARDAALAYGCTFIVIAIFFNLLWRYAAHEGRLIDPRADQREVSGITRSYLPGTLLYAAATLLAFASPWASAAAYAAIVAFYVISSSVFGTDTG
jgi:TMEM175 potassium channel family protein